MPPQAEWVLKTDANIGRKSPLQQQAMPLPRAVVSQSVKDKDFDLNDVFFDLKPEDLPRK